MHVIVSRRLAAFATVAMLAAAGQAVGATCKGQPEQACTTDATCVWVSGYARKDGVEVKGYCRSKGSNKSEKPQAKSESGKQGT